MDAVIRTQWESSRLLHGYGATRMIPEPPRGRQRIEIAIGRHQNHDWMA